MGKKVEKTGIKREKGYLYFLDKKGNVARCKMVRGRMKQKQKQEVLVKCGIKREEGFLYYIDKDGDVAMTKMARK